MLTASINISDGFKSEATGRGRDGEESFLLFCCEIQAAADDFAAFPPTNADMTQMKGSYSGASAGGRRHCSLG